ncbi:MAG: hypothetical protein Q7S95_03960 [bacterium]|nr:hypothetical protein [bacterium]
MCHSTLAARGVKKIHPSYKESRTKSSAPLHDEKEIARRKDLLQKKAKRPKIVAKRARRSRAKKEKEGMKNLRHQGLIH